MYIEGIQVGTNSYLLSDEYGTLTLLNGTGVPKEMEEYIKLQNDYEEKMNEKGGLQHDLFEVNNKAKQSKTANIEIILSTILIEGVFILLGATNLALIESIKILGLPIVTSLIATFIIKPIKYGTKKKRAKQKVEINSKLEKVLCEIKEIEKKKQKLQKNIENESYFYEDEIVPVTTIENKKVNVKMRVLRLEQSR